jgi:hypothetical protein
MEACHPAWMLRHHCKQRKNPWAPADDAPAEALTVPPGMARHCVIAVDTVFPVKCQRLDALVWALTELMGGRPPMQINPAAIDQIRAVGRRHAY